MTHVVQHDRRFVEELRDLPPPTSDDVTILRDGRRLDSAEKVRAFVAEFESDQARPASIVGDAGGSER